MLEILQINVRLEITLQTMVRSVDVTYRSVFCSGSRDIGRVPMTSSTDSHPHSKTTV